MYADPRFFHWALDHRKHAMAVLKDERRDLLADAESLFADQPPTAVREGTPPAGVLGHGGLHDLAAGPHSRPGDPQPGDPIHPSTVGRPVEEQVLSEWTWVTTLPTSLASTGAVVRIGHARWSHRERGLQRTGQPLACRPRLPP